MEQFNYSALLNPAVVWVLIPLGGLLVGLVLHLFRMHHRHVERMAMIEAGIDPDAVNRDALESSEWSSDGVESPPVAAATARRG